MLKIKLTRRTFRINFRRYQLSVQFKPWTVFVYNGDEEIYTTIKRFDGEYVWEDDLA